MSLIEVIRREMSGLVELTPAVLDRLQAHYDLMLHWNRILNLTTVTDVEDAALRHYCESLYLARVLTPGRVADVGSGAGFPGLVVAIVRQDCQFDLIESHQRKAVFLREASRGLRNVRVVAKRAESVPDRYQWVVSRAVRPAEVVRMDLAPCVALLVGDEDANRLNPPGSVPAFALYPLPWGENRTLAVRSQ